MGFNDGRINEEETILDLFGQGIKYAFPDTPFTPPHIAIVDRRSRPIALWQTPPMRTGPQNIEYPVENPTIILPTRTTDIFWQ